MIETLEKQMNLIESQLVDTHDSTLYNNLKEMKRREERIESCFE